jgi:hypothetical protein
MPRLPIRSDDGFNPRLHTQMLIDTLKMLLDRPRTDAERQTNFLIRQLITHRRPLPRTLAQSTTALEMGGFGAGAETLNSPVCGNGAEPARQNHRSNSSQQNCQKTGVPKRGEDEHQITDVGPGQHHKLLSGAPRMEQQECTHN